MILEIAEISGNSIDGYKVSKYTPVDVSGSAAVYLPSTDELNDIEDNEDFPGKEALSTFIIDAGIVFDDTHAGDLIFRYDDTGDWLLCFAAAVELPLCRIKEGD